MFGNREVRWAFGHRISKHPWIPHVQAMQSLMFGHLVKTQDHGSYREGLTAMPGGQPEPAGPLQIHLVAAKSWLTDVPVLC